MSSRRRQPEDSQEQDGPRRSHVGVVVIDVTDRASQQQRSTVARTRFSSSDLFAPFRPQPLASLLTGGRGHSASEVAQMRAVREAFQRAASRTAAATASNGATDESTAAAAAASATARSSARASRTSAGTTQTAQARTNTTAPPPRMFAMEEARRLPMMTTRGQVTRRAARAATDGAAFHPGGGVLLETTADSDPMPRLIRRATDGPSSSASRTRAITGVPTPRPARGNARLRTARMSTNRPGRTSLTGPAPVRRSSGPPARMSTSTVPPGRTSRTGPSPVRRSSRPVRRPERLTITLRRSRTATSNEATTAAAAAASVAARSLRTSDGTTQTAEAPANTTAPPPMRGSHVFAVEETRPLPMMIRRGQVTRRAARATTDGAAGQRGGRVRWETTADSDPMPRLIRRTTDGPSSSASRAQASTGGPAPRPARANTGEPTSAPIDRSARRWTSRMSTGYRHPVRGYTHHVRSPGGMTITIGSSLYNNNSDRTTTSSTTTESPPPSPPTRRRTRSMTLAARRQTRSMTAAAAPPSAQRKVAVARPSRKRKAKAIKGSGCSCCICMDEPDQSNVASIDGCEHRFCFDCIEQWADRENTCPLCKVRFSQISRIHKKRFGTKIKRVDNRSQRSNHTGILVTAHALRGLFGGPGRRVGAFPAEITRFIFEELDSIVEQMNQPVQVGVQVVEHHGVEVVHNNDTAGAGSDDQSIEI